MFTSMKLKNTFLLLLLLVFTGQPWVHAQDKRTLETRVADVLALFPARDASEAERLFNDLINLPDEGLYAVVERVVPNGKPEGVAPRYAVSLLTHHASSASQKARIEKAYLHALAQTSNTEVGAYFIENLKRIGTNASVKPLAGKIDDEGLADQAIGALVSINSDESKEALLVALAQRYPASTHARLIQAVGEVGYAKAVPAVSQFAADPNEVIRRHALWTLARIADAASYDVLLKAARRVGFTHDPAEATHALIEYIHRLAANGNAALATKASKEVLRQVQAPGQQHFRLAALQALAKTAPAASTKVLVKEMDRFDAGYQKEVLNIASLNLNSEAATKRWKKFYRKTSSGKADVLRMLAQADRSDDFVRTALLPALESRDPELRMTAAEEIAYSPNKEFHQPVIDFLMSAESDDELKVAKASLLRMLDQDNVGALAPYVDNARPAVQAVLLGILAERRANDYFDVALKHTSSSDAAVRKAAFSALPRLASARDTEPLLELLSRTEDTEQAGFIQQALIESIDKNSHAAINAAYARNKAMLLPLLPYVNDEGALDRVIEAFESENKQEKAAAFQALTNWQDHQAVRKLLAIRRDPALAQYHEEAFQALVRQTTRASLPDDQKLLILDAAMEEASTNAERASVIRAVGTLRSFLALVFVSEYLDDEQLNGVASRSVMQIALPTADGRPGLTGAFVRSTLQKILDKLEGQDSQYEVIDIQTYLADMPYTRGYESIFNGKDLSGWQGLVENPIARAKMSRQQLAQKQKRADAKMRENWSVKDGVIVFNGKGDNLCTVRKYGDFEMYVDWRISRDGDSGIYLRGTPQVQIWDPWGSSELARVGSGGLFNNEKHADKPLQVADNPIGEWNTFHIRMVGEKVTVHLNGVKVVDDVVMENYWDRSIPIFSEEAIELQAHGNEIAFRNLYIKELGGKPYELSPEEKEEGFEVLFNGKDLDNWVGNKTEYVVEDNTIAIYPKGKGHGNLFTEKEYSDFIFRFAFQLTPGANNGLGIHAGLGGDVAYGGKEIQILDDTAPVYAKLEPYQYHGSVYGLVPAKRGHLRPVGEWNEQEVYVKGDRIRVVLNGTVIVDADLKQATKNGTLDKREHPGLNVRKGHIGFLGHGTIVRFRDIRIKELK